MLQIHYIRVSFARSALFFAIGLALVALVACSSGGGGDDENSSSSGGRSSSAIRSSSSGEGNSSGGESPSSSGGSSSGGSISSSGGGSSSSGGGGVSSAGSVNVDVENAIKIEYKGSSVEITNPYSEVRTEKDGADVVIRISDASTTEYNFVLSGTTSNGSLKFYGDVKKGLYLNGVSITNTKGPAINIQKSKRISVHLVDGTKNTLTDGENYSAPPTGDTKAKGAFFSEGRLEFNKGNGSLEVKGKYNHAIVVDNAIEIKYGKITVSEAENDGIHANDSIRVSGGEITIKSKGDAIQSEKAPEGPVNEWVVFSGGTINAQTTEIKSHGISSEGGITITGDANITISVVGKGSKGIRSRSWVEFKGGKTSIKTSGDKYTNPASGPADTEDESNSTGVKIATDLMFNDGELTVTTTGTGAKGINIDGKATIKGGKINIDAKDDGIKIKGKLEITGGTVNVEAGGKQLNLTGTTSSCSKTGGTIDFTCGGF
jgi:hypothetical protein